MKTEPAQSYGEHYLQANDEAADLSVGKVIKFIDENQGALLDDFHDWLREEKAKVEARKEKAEER